MRNRVQRYKCTGCQYRFQHARRDTGKIENIWYAYTHRKQTLGELAHTYGRSHVWVRKQLDAHEATPTDLVPQPTVIVADTTFWGRSYGVCVFRSWNLKRNIWWGEVSSELMAHYHYGRKILEARGWMLTGAVIDGRRGLATVFKDMPVQVCHFHQMKTVTRYLTRRPETQAGQDLRILMLTIPHTDEQTFTRKLTAWEQQYRACITEKTYVVGTKYWYYTHKNVRSAYRSLHTNLLNLGVKKLFRCFFTPSTPPQ